GETDEQRRLLGDHDGAGRQLDRCGAVRVCDIDLLTRDEECVRIDQCRWRWVRTDDRDAYLQQTGRRSWHATHRLDVRDVLANRTSANSRYDRGRRSES